MEKPLVDLVGAASRKTNDLGIFRPGGNNNLGEEGSGSVEHNHASVQ
jgi:hypothetical protein